MSDVDDMEIDGPADASITFSALEKGKKLSKANLPVSAGDTLPWVEKYRPDTLDDVSGHEDILTTINKFVETNRLPHLLFYGPPGTGKTSTILALARKIFGPKNIRQQVLELNASDDRGIDVVREQIKTFASTRQIFTTAASKEAGAPSHLAGFKLIILDEADAMTSVAQNALRRIMEKYTANTRFCIIANYTHKLNPALLSRCTRFRFSPLPLSALERTMNRVVEAEKVKITEDAKEALVRLARGDMRRVLNVLQACYASSTPLPGDKNRENDTITTSMIYECVAAPDPEDIKIILDTLLTEDVTTSMRTVVDLKTKKGLALSDILGCLGDELCRLEVEPHVRVKWMEGLAEIEWRVGSGGNEIVQTGGMCGVVRSGVELMGKKVKA